MANTVELNEQQLRIQGLIGQYLASQRNEFDTDRGAADHLDQDTLSAFVEGSINKRETDNIVGHLVRCSFCRHISAELIRLEYDMADAPVAVAVSEPSKAKMSEVLSGLFSKIFGTSDSAVFAHNEDENADEETDGSERSKETEEK